MNEVIQLQIWQVAAAYIFILLLLLIVRAKGISREKEILISSARMTIQLVLTGYILVYLFANPHPLTTIAIVMIMEVFAIHNIIRRSGRKLSFSLKKIIAFSMLIGTLTSLVFFIFVQFSYRSYFNEQDQFLI